MIELTGTPKQVELANKVRARFLKTGTGEDLWLGLATDEAVLIVDDASIYCKWSQVGSEENLAAALRRKAKEVSPEFAEKMTNNYFKAEAKKLKAESKKSSTPSFF